MTQMLREASSFRDPSGHILYAREEVYRSLDREAHQLLRSFLQSPANTQLAERELLVATDTVDDATQNALASEEGLANRSYVRHEKLWFVSYPYEWTGEMLLEAARCTLAVQSLLLDHGFNLKDASAYNVQFDFGSCGPTPTFIDIGSIERLPDTGGLWLAYKQFVSHFLLPLLYLRRMGHDFKGTFLADLDGLDPEQAYRICGPLRRFFPPYLTLVTLPHFLRHWEASRNLLQSRPGPKRSQVQQEKALFILRHTVRSLQRKIDRLEGGARKSTWAEYEDSDVYPAEAKAEKVAFVRRVCEQVKPEAVLDVGCNVGKFSLIAAEAGARVLAVDTDMASLDRLWRRARELKATVLPLRLDITNPSPGIGWKNAERAAFLDRAQQFDCVLALAVVHHLLVSRGIPLVGVADLLRGLTRRYLLLELIDPSDPMFQRLLRGRESLYSELSLEAQEQVFGRHFSILQSHSLTGMSRRLYLLEKL